MPEDERTDPDDVFINCPFDTAYRPTFQALVFTVYACGFRPRSAFEMDDAAETRIYKLFRIIEQCRYGIHDLSRTELDPAHGLPRFNMPFELGLFMAAKQFGNRGQKLKRVLILDVEQYRYQRFISDLAGSDVHSHGGDPRRAIEEVRDWLATVSRRRLPSGPVILGLHDRFRADLPAVAAKLGFDPDRIPYVDLERIIVGWLTEAPELNGQ